MRHSSMQNSKLLILFSSIKADRYESYLDSFLHFGHLMWTYLGWSCNIFPGNMGLNSRIDMYVVYDHAGQAQTSLHLN